MTLRDAEDTETAFEFVVDGDRLAFEHREVPTASDDGDEARTQDDRIVGFLRDRRPETFAQRDIAGQPHPAPWKALDADGLSHDIAVVSASAPA